MPGQRNRPLRWVHLLVLLASLAVRPLAAQDERFRVRRLGVADGLSHSEVTCFLKDRSGFVWIGTDRGLNRFDGHDFRWFLRDDSGRGLPDNSIQALLEDQKGNIWIGTANAGLTVFDPVTETLRTFRNEPKDPQSLAHDRVYALHQGARGRLFVGTKGGLSELDLADGIPALPRFRNSKAGTAPGDLTNDRVSSVLEDSSGTLWVGTKKGLHRRRPGASAWDVFRQDPQNPVAINDEEVYSLLQDDGGDLWIGTWGGGGLSRLPRSELGSATPRFQRFDFPPDDPRSPGGSILMDIVQDSAGDLWFGSTDGGLGRLLREERERETPRFLHYKPDLLDPSSLQSPSAGQLLDDGQGTLWIAEGQNGIALWDRATERLALYRHRPSEPTLLPKPPVAAVLEDSAGRIWVGTGSGLTRITPRTGPFDAPAVKHFRADPAGKDPAALASENVYALLEDRRSRIWVGTVRGGLAMLAPGSDRFVTFRGKRGAEAQLQNDTVLSLLEDASGAIWVGTYEGLYRLDEGDGDPSRFRFQAFHHEAGNPRSLSNDSVETLFQDKAGRIWIGTYAGLNVLRPGETTVERVIPKERTLAMLGTGFVHGLLEAQDGTLWIGTGDGGLVQYDPATGGGRALVETAGLASRLVLGVARDARGRLWFPTPSGLHRYDPAASRITVFGRADGLQSDVGSRGAWHAGRSGRLYFGGPGGLSVFSPADLAAEAAPPNVVLTEFLLANRPVSVSPGGRLERQVASLPLLTISPKETVFALSFSALVPRNPSRVRYAYRMEGFDEAWIETDWKNRRATYTNLPPGSYRFRVVAARVFSPLSEEGGASLAIRVLPPWYRTLWFRLLLALATIGTPVLVLLARNRRLERSRQELEREVAARTHDLASANVRLEKQARELALVQEKLARILDSAPQAASDVEGWAVAMAGEVRRALGALELGVFALRGSAFEALSSDGIDIPPPDLSNVEATASGEIPLVAPNQRTTIPLKGPTGQLYGALVILLPRALKEDERRLLVGFAQQLGAALEMKRLRSDLHAAAASRAASLREYHERGIATLQVCGSCSRCFDHTATVCTLCGGELHAPRAIPFKLLDRYRFETLLGQGGMGMVLAARDERLERDVAIKLIKPDQLADDRTRVRFEQEARTIARISHRNVVAVFDSGELPDGTAYLVMERLEGCDLASLIALAGRGRPEEVAALVRQSAAALSAAHREGIIHRDIKPQNIFREGTGNAGLSFKVLDFGLAKSLGAEGGLTLTGTVVGTPAYMSPEQVRGSVLDVRTDVYSLAVVVYEALTGTRLVDTDDIGSAFLTVATSVPLPPSALLTGIPEEVDALLLAALEKDREKRPYDISVWGEALGAALEKHAAQTTGDEATTAGWVVGSTITFD